MRNVPPKSETSQTGSSHKKLSTLRDWLSGRTLVRKFGVLYATLIAMSVNFMVVISVVLLIADKESYSIAKAFVITAGVHILLTPQAYQVFATMNKLDQMRALLYHKSVTDELTGAYNRRFFIEELNQLFASVINGDSQFSIIQFDVDNFKSVNDTYGHAMGDQVIRMIATLCQQNARLDDVFARLGGEEFAFLLKDLDVAALTFAERIRHAVHTSPIELNHIRLFVSISIGVSCYAPALTIDDILRLGDMAMYQVKAQGKNCVVVADTSSDVMLRRSESQP